jgi:iron(III) transport system ATP-binding protein
MDRDRSLTAATDLLSVHGLRKVYGNGYTALQDVTVTLARGRSLVVVGGSGSGKSTFLRCVAGLEMPDAGSVSIDGQTVIDTSSGVFVPPERRRISMMFQDYALWPHMTVRENVTYPIRRERDREVVRRRVDETLEMVGCRLLAEKRPSELSGGEQQRVALARSLVSVPSLLLADEPFSNLDTVLRDRIRGDFLAMRQAVGFSLVHVTHDPREAMMLGDTVLVLYQSRTEDFGPPLRVYTRPRTVIAAQALGVVNQFPARVTEVGQSSRDGESVAVTLETAISVLHGMAPRGTMPGSQVVAVSRPTQLRIEPAPESETGPNRVPGRVRYSTVLGDLTEYSIALANGDELRAERFQGAAIAPGTQVHATVAPEHLWAALEQRGQGGHVGR